MTRDQAYALGWTLLAPPGGHNPEIDGHLREGQGDKIDRGFWVNADGKVVCWDIDLEKMTGTADG